MSDLVNTHKLGYCCRYASGETCVGCGDAENGIDPELASAPRAAPRLDLDDVAKEVHAAWRDGMLNQGRPVSRLRLKWETLDQLDHELDRYIAGRVQRLVREDERRLRVEDK